MNLWPVEHFFPPFFSRSALISTDLEKNGGKSVQLVRGSFFQKYFLWNPYFNEWIVDTKFCFILWLLIKFAYNPQLRRNGHYSLEHPPNERSRYRMQKCYCAPISQATPDHLWFDVLFEVNRTSYPSYYLLLGFSFLRLLSFSGGTMSTWGHTNCKTALFYLAKTTK